MSDLPSGTVTFLFTDIEGSTRRWEENPQAMKADIAVHDALVRDQLPPGVKLLDMGERRLRDLLHEEHIFQVVDPELPGDFPPLRTLEGRANNLPMRTTPLVGREQEVRACRDLLRRTDVRL